jgi:hypothetical protein
MEDDSSPAVPRRARTSATEEDTMGKRTSWGRVRIAGAAALFVAVAAGALALTGGVAEAGKPSGGGDSGVVFFDTYAGSGAPRNVWTMNPNGAGKSVLPGGVSSLVNGSPSRGLHGGHRWFLAQRPIAGEYYGDGLTQRRELFAVRDDGAAATQLTSQTDLMPYLGTRWSPDDSVISWSAQRWVGGVAGSPQIYTAGVVFDAAGDVAALVSQPAAPTVPLAHASLHDWSPDGARIVVGLDAFTSSGALWIFDVASSAATPLATSVAASWPTWSPDGSRVAFAGNDGTLRTIAPSGAAERVLVTRRVKGATDLDISFVGPEWSPHGTHLVYVKREILGRQDVWRIGGDGSGATNLTTDLNTQSGGGSPAATLGWR